MSNDDRALEELQTIARSWMTARGQIVQARDKAAEASVFGANRGTHMAFLKALVQHQQQLAGVMVRIPWTPKEIEAFGELVRSWDSEVQNAAIRLGGTQR